MIKIDIMAEVEKEKKKRHSKKSSRVSMTPLNEHAELFHAIENFIRANSNFESSIPVNTTIEMLGDCTTLQDVFTLVLRRQLLNMDGALRWAFFLSLAPARAENDGDRPFSGASPFSVSSAFSLVASVYDIGVSEAIYDHFEYETDSDSDSDSGSESGSSDSAPENDEEK